MPKRPDNQPWRYWRTVAGAAAAAAIVAVGAFTGHVRFAHANDVVDCAQVKCVALTFDDGPTPVHRPTAGHPERQQRQGDVLRDRQQGRRQPGRRKTGRRRGHGTRQPHLGTPEHDHAAAGRRPGAVLPGQRCDRRRHRRDAEIVAPAGRPHQRGGQRAGRQSRSGRESFGTSSLSTGSTTPTPRPAGLC